jgi:hypothetical protein
MLRWMAEAIPEAMRLTSEIWQRNDKGWTDDQIVAYLESRGL